ncbi:MAG: hypothetical protein M3O02_06375 [Acidobacteriota bacterium]|nr:hypothetical protein [Acidobacteriota bacterium]
MTLFSSLRSCAAAATWLAILLAAPLPAQTEPRLPAPTPADTSHYHAALLLPEAPQPQDSTPPAATPGSSSSSSAAAPPPGPHELTPAEIREQQREQAERDLQAEKKQRLLGIMPQFQTVVAGKAVPLTAGQKWTLASRTAIDPFYIGYALIVGGGYSELDGSHTGYHWGPAGYFKRVGANYADNIDGALIGNGLLPIVLHQDPRYFRLGAGSFGHRFVHAAVSTVVCLGDNGHRQANVSNVLGNFISGAISNAYYPADERGISLTLQNGAEVTALGAIGGQLLEFGPDINRLLHRHSTPPAARSPASATP